MANIGSALTGQKDPADDPLQSIVTGAASSPAYQSILGDPASRAALLQIGLNMAQPQAMGQSAIGHIGQAIGSGGEEVSRAEEADLKEEQARTKMEQAQQALDIKRQEAADYGRGITQKGATDKSQLELLRQQGQQSLLGTKNYHNAAIETFAAVQKAKQAAAANIVDPDAVKNLSNDPIFQKYGNKDIGAIERMMRAEDTGGGGGTPPGRFRPGQRIRQGGHTFTVDESGNPVAD